MADNVIDQIPDELISQFRESENQPVLETIKKNWRSLVCMTCGACCCSSVVPVTEKDFNDFYSRLDLEQSKEEFAEALLANPHTKSVNYSLETVRYGGRCMFLARKNYFECVVWEERMEVCSQFFCWEITNFEKWLNGEKQETFTLDGGGASDEEWLQSFGLLLAKLQEEPALSFFKDDMLNYARLRAQHDIPSYFEKRPDKFTKKSDRRV